MRFKTADSHAHPLTVAAVIGSLSVALGVVLLTSGVLGGMAESLLASYRGAGFALPDAHFEPWWGLLILFVGCYGTAWVLLETPGTGRRTLLLATILVLVAAASPVMALWGVFWCPVVALITGTWSGFCAIMWARQNAMPCEVAEEPHPGKVIPMTGRDERKKVTVASPVKKPRKRRKR